MVYKCVSSGWHTLQMTLEDSTHIDDAHIRMTIWAVQNNLLEVLADDAEALGFE